MAMPQPSDGTIRLVWEGVTAADRMRPFYS